jgi:hypothetical protein
MPNWLEAARQALVDAYGPDSVRSVVQVIIRNAVGQVINFSLPPDGWTPPAQISMTFPVRELPTMERRIYEVLLQHGKPATSRETARLSGCAFGSRFMAALRSLRQRRLVVLETEGYQARASASQTE